MDTPHRFRAHVEVTLFALGVMALVFVAGILVGRTGGFPYPVLRAAWAAGLDWKDNWRHYLGVRSNHAKPTKRPAGGVTIHDPALAFDGYTLVTAYRLDGYNAYLLDMDGTIVHRWDAALSRVLPDPGRVRAFGGDGNIELHGAHLYRNGDLVLDLDGAGTTKLDRCSKVLWTVARSTHHNVEPLPDGSVITPASVRRSEEHPDLPFVGPGAAGYYVDDVVLRLGPDGSVLEERSVIDMLFRRGWVSTLRSGPGSDKKINDEDPLHLNDVDVLTAELAPAFPMFEAGDLLVSLRDLNTLFVADRAGRQVKWVMTGPFLGQHDPDFLPNGHLLVYDNRIYLKEPRLGNTRLLEIDPASHRVRVELGGRGRPIVLRSGARRAAAAAQRQHLDRRPARRPVARDRPRGGRQDRVGVGEPDRAGLRGHGHRRATVGARHAALGRPALRRADRRRRRFTPCATGDVTAVRLARSLDLTDALEVAFGLGVRSRTASFLPGPSILLPVVSPAG